MKYSNKKLCTPWISWEDIADKTQAEALHHIDFPAEYPAAAPSIPHVLWEPGQVHLSQKPEGACQKGYN